MVPNQQLLEQRHEPIQERRVIASHRMRSAQDSAQALVHFLSPTRTKHSHEKDYRAACESNQTKDSEQPAIANGIDDRSCDKRPYTGEDVSHEVVQRHTF